MHYADAASTSVVARAAEHRSNRSRRGDANRDRSITWAEALLLCALACALVAGAALSGGTPAVPEHLAPVRVESGDSLWSLAASHPVEGMSTAETVEMLAAVNNIGNSSLRVGSEVMVPVSERLATARARR
jgi:hypothetical protein